MNHIHMLDQLSRNWGWIALRGGAAMIFGVLAIAWPGVTLVVLAIFFGAYALIDGVCALIAAYRRREGHRPVWPLVLVGVLGVGTGFLTFLWPEMTALALLMFIAVWALMIGIAQIAAAIRLRKEIDNEWMLGLRRLVRTVRGPDGRKPRCRGCRRRVDHRRVFDRLRPVVGRSGIPAEEGGRPSA